MERTEPALTPEGVAANQLRALRTSHGMTQEQLAAACAAAGASAYTAIVIHRLESGERRWRLNDVYALADVLAVSPLLLMLPANAEAKMILTGSRSARASQVYEWTVGTRPTPTSDEVTDEGRVRAWLRLRMYLPYASRTSGKLRVEIDENNIAELLRDNEKRED